MLFVLGEGAIQLNQIHPRFALGAPSSCRAASGQLQGGYANRISFSAVANPQLEGAQGLSQETVVL